MSGLYWFQPPTPSGESLDTILARLHPLGVRWRSWTSPQPAVHYRVEDGELVAEIGVITVDPAGGEIGIWAYRNLGTTESKVLAACAQLAFERPPRKADCWQFCRRGGKPRWQSSILVRVDEAGGIAGMIARHQHSMRSSLNIALNQALIEVAP